MADNKNKRQPLLGIQRSRQEIRGEDGFDLYNRISEMTDDEFNQAVSSGEITPEQIEKAGRYAHENYLLDVWSETDRAESEPEPTYEQFIADPAKYGASAEQYARFRPKVTPESLIQNDPVAKATYEKVRSWDRREATNKAVNPAATAPADNTAVASKPVPQK